MNKESATIAFRINIAVIVASFLVGHHTDVQAMPMVMYLAGWTFFASGLGAVLARVILGTTPGGVMLLALGCGTVSGTLLSRWLLCLGTRHE